MKKILLLLPLIALLCSGLRVPDNEDIIAKTINSDSPYYYPNLLRRYMANDTTLTQTEYHYLYYGFTYTRDYRPLVSIPAKDDILRIFEFNAQPTREDFVRIIESAQEVMKYDPFSPSNLNFLVYAYGSLGDTVNEKIYFDKFLKVMNTIDESGTGEKESSPKHVLMFSHANDFVTAKGYGAKSSQLVSNKVEYIFYNQRAENGDRGMYFDYSRVYLVRPDEIPEREKGWTLNNAVPLGKNKDN